ncbi:MAG: hypothetical protein ACPL4K_00425 [Candidatus Margulisiibacteriota bacterium]
MRKLTTLLVIFWFSQSLTMASYISLKTTIEPKILDHKIKIKVSSINKGDESAYNVQSQLRFGNKIFFAPKQMELTPNARYQAQAEFPLALTKPGSYPLILVMHYTDANQYPFSAPLVQTFAYRSEAISPITGKLNPITISKDGKLPLSLKNSSDAEVKLKLQFVLPQELSADEKTTTLDLAPKSEQILNIPIKNFSALSGSSYQVFAIVQTEDKSWHYTNVFPTLVKIVPPQEIFGVSYQIIFVILILLIFFLVGAQFFKRL